MDNFYLEVTETLPIFDISKTKNMAKRKYYYDLEIAKDEAIKKATDTVYLEPASVTDTYNTGTLFYGRDMEGNSTCRVRQTYDDNNNKAITISYTNRN